MIKILIAEDDTFLTNSYKTHVENTDDIEVDIAHDGIETIEKVNEINPSLIILDLLMPRKGGVETLEELKNNPDTKNIPVIIATNIDDEENKRKCQELGCVEYLIKSEISLSQLDEKIREHALENN